MLERYSLFTTSVEPYTCGFTHHLFCKLSMEKLQSYANIPFMLYVPYSTVFVHENESKDQEINQSCKTISLKRDESRLSKKTVESHCQSRFQLP